MKLLTKFAKNMGSSVSLLSVLVMFGFLCGSSSATPMLGVALAGLSIKGSVGTNNIVSKSKISGNFSFTPNVSAPKEEYGFPEWIYSLTLDVIVNDYQFFIEPVPVNTTNAQQIPLDLVTAIEDFNLGGLKGTFDPNSTGSILKVKESGGGFDQGTNIQSAVTTIPEPTTLALLGLGIAGLGFARRSLGFRKP